MNAPPPPYGQPWLANVGNNPNINRDPPPPPIQPGEGPIPIHIEIGGGMPPPLIGVVANDAAPGVPPQIIGGMPMQVPPGMAPPPYAPMGMGIGSFGPYDRIPHPQPNSGVSPLPGGYGMGGMGMGMGMGGMMGGFPPPFAAGGMPWAGGAGMGMGGMGMGGFGFPGMHPPPPPFIDGAVGLGKAPGDQNDPTVKPGGDLPGHTIVEPAETTSINRILTNAAPWETVGMPFTVEPMQFDAGWTINRVIKAMRKPQTECVGWGATECLELGGGRWARGMTYVYGTHQATESSISAVGWGPNRGRDGKEPCYVYCHKI